MVTRMNLSEYKKVILGASIRDWTHIACEGGNCGPSYKYHLTGIEYGKPERQELYLDCHYDIFSLKKNLLISLAEGMLSDDEFYPEWIPAPFDKKAQTRFVDFFYAGELVFRDRYVMIQGGEGKLPYPDVNPAGEGKIRYFVPREKFEFYKLFNQENHASYLQLFDMTRIPLENASWMADTEE